MDTSWAIPSTNIWKHLTDSLLHIEQVTRNLAEKASVKFDPERTFAAALGRRDVGTRFAEYCVPKTELNLNRDFLERAEKNFMPTKKSRSGKWTLNDALVEIFSELSAYPRIPKEQLADTVFALVSGYPFTESPVRNNVEYRSILENKKVLFGELQTLSSSNNASPQLREALRDMKILQAFVENIIVTRADRENIIPRLILIAEIHKNNFKPSTKELFTTMAGIKSLFDNTGWRTAPLARYEPETYHV